MTNAWTTSDYRHNTLPYEPQDHSGNLPCTACHLSNTDFVAWQYPGFQPTCAGCHAGDYELKPHKKVVKNAVPPSEIKYTVSEIPDCAGACHQYTDATFTTISKFKTGEHHISDGTWDN